MKGLTRIMQLNVEGLEGRSIAKVLRRILDEEKIDILAIQETYTHNIRSEQTNGRVELME